MKASILSCLWLAAWNTPPWRLLPQISLFLHREGGDVLGASRGERAALGLFVFGWVLFFSPPQVSKSCCFQLVACITPGLKMHLAGLGIFASQEGHQARASDFWSSHLHNLLLVALQKDGRPSHEPLWLGAANVVIRHCSFWGERAKKPLFGFREKRRVRSAWGFLAWVSLQLSVLLPPSALISFFFFSCIKTRREFRCCAPPWQNKSEMLNKAKMPPKSSRLDKTPHHKSAGAPTPTLGGGKLGIQLLQYG